MVSGRLREAPPSGPVHSKSVGPGGWEVLASGPEGAGAPLALGWIREEEPIPEDRAGPGVLGLSADLFRVGDAATLDGAAGSVDLPEVRRIDVVTAFLQRDDGRILLMRRSERVGSFQGHWATVSGFLEGRAPELQARQEILEETGLGEGSLTLANRGTLVWARAEERMFVVHPFRFWTRSSDVRLDWEHTEFEWVAPSELLTRPTVPKLDRVWAVVQSDA